MYDFFSIYSSVCVRACARLVFMFCIDHLPHRATPTATVKRGKFISPHVLGSSAREVYVCGYEMFRRD